jgi:hypothetical protein
MTSSAGQSPHHGLQDDIWGGEGGRSCRGETPIPSDLEADFPQPVMQRRVMVTGNADFCRDREVLEIPDPEGVAADADSDLLAFAVGVSLQAEERVVYFAEDEAPVVRLNERANEWEVDSDSGREPEGEARGLSSPARISEMEQRVEEYLRVATLDIETLFPRPVCDLTCRHGGVPRKRGGTWMITGRVPEGLSRLSRSTGSVGSRPRYGGEKGMKRLGASWRRETGSYRSGKRN